MKLTVYVKVLSCLVSIISRFFKQLVIETIIMLYRIYIHVAVQPIPQNGTMYISFSYW